MELIHATHFTADQINIDHVKEKKEKQVGFRASKWLKLVLCHVLPAKSDTAKTRKGTRPLLDRLHPVMVGDMWLSK